MAKVAFSTQIKYETLILLNEYIKQHPELSKAYITDEALKEYISSRIEKEKEKEKY